MDGRLLSSVAIDVRVLLVWDTDMTDVELEVMYGCLLWSVSNLLVNPEARSAFRFITRRRMVEWCLATSRRAMVSLLIVICLILIYLNLFTLRSTGICFEKCSCWSI